MAGADVFMFTTLIYPVADLEWVQPAVPPTATGGCEGKGCISILVQTKI